MLYLSTVRQFEYLKWFLIKRCALGISYTEYQPLGIPKVGRIKAKQAIYIPVEIPFL